MSTNPKPYPKLQMVILEMTYSKKLGLPSFSSHSCSVSLKVEIPDVSQVEQQSHHLYKLLQTAVDQEIQAVGFMPDPTTYGHKINGNGKANGSYKANGYTRNNGQTYHVKNGSDGPRNGVHDWNCSSPQRVLILRTIGENNLDKNDVEARSMEMFGVGVKALNKLQASQVIEWLLEITNKGSQKSNWRSQPQTQRA